MSKLQPTVASARDFFSGELRTVMERHRVSAQKPSFDYLVDLMVHYMDSDRFFVKDADGKLQNNVLADLYIEYLNGTPERKKHSLKRLGDICLLISGFFADSLKRKVVHLDYYLGMGGTAYWKLSRLANGPVFHELAVKFKPYADVLGEMSERSGLQSNSDLLRLYERWLCTGSDRLKSLLSEHGIAPVKMDVKTRH